MSFSGHFNQYLLILYTVNAFASVPMLLLLWRSKRWNKTFHFDFAWAINVALFFWICGTLRWLDLLHGPAYWTTAWIFAIPFHGIINMSIKAYLNGR